VDIEKFNIQKEAYESTLKVYTEKLQNMENQLKQEKEAMETLQQIRDMEEK